MTLSQLIPLIKDLSHSDKLLLVHFLVTDSLQEAGLSPLTVEDRLASQGLYDSFDAVAVLAQALAEEHVVTHG